MRQREPNLDFRSPLTPFLCSSFHAILATTCGGGRGGGSTLWLTPFLKLDRRYEWNDISCNGRCGVQIKSGSAPYFRHNRIHHEKQAGVLTAEDGTGVLEDNDIFDNQWSGVQTEGPSNPLLRRNRIHHNGGAGFIAYQNGSGRAACVEPVCARACSPPRAVRATRRLARGQQYLRQQEVRRAKQDRRSPYSAHEPDT